VEYGIEAKDNPERRHNPSADSRLYTGTWLDYQLGQYQQRLRSTEQFNPRIETFYGAGWTGAAASLVLDSAPK